MNNILLGIFFLILGLLFANMLTKFCGCRDLIEGQCDAASDGDCVWNSAECPMDGSIVYSDDTVPPEQHTNFLSNLCKEEAVAIQHFTVNDTPVSPNLFPGQGDIAHSTISDWRDTRCCFQLDIQDPCFPNPCENDGVCSLEFPTAAPLCDCTDDYTGDFCEETVSNTGSGNTVPSGSSNTGSGNTVPGGTHLAEQCIFSPGKRYILSAEGDNIIAQIL